MSAPSETTRLAEGFPGQRMRVLPRPLVAQALRAPVTGQLLVTDVGFFPKASSHGRERARGAPQDIVIVCAAGRGTCVLPSGTHSVRAGQAVVIPAGVPHTYEADATEPWTIWWMHLVGRSVPELFEAIGATAQQPVFGLGDPARVVSLIDTIIRRMERDETTSTLIAASGAAWYALSLLAADRRALGRESVDPVQAAIEHLLANASSRVSLAELAGMAGLSESHFAVRFRRATGYGALEYQTRLRMGLARELLDTTDRTITSIARQVGYPDPLYFSRQFRRIHGTSPTEYRSHDKG
ncbi:AraC family transcriptional regulator [Actinotalea sp. K2]|uniref:AraC family transcriptional regulator n=1 Tax=Actinotalea sp. K2 TaxID=2939438 RepID=UPI002016AD9A|nr:AraC family transcriptional regulator [Actinotalea sp. K2]MCL3860817.1 AraC family transcriptional regulator [Actinotalea sp. K2]